MQRARGDQPTFFDLAVAARTGSNRVLETIDRLVDFSEAERLLEQTYSPLGRPAHRAALMLRLMILHPHMTHADRGRLRATTRPSTST